MCWLYIHYIYYNRHRLSFFCLVNTVSSISVWNNDQHKGKAEKTGEDEVEDDEEEAKSSFVLCDYFEIFLTASSKSEMLLSSMILSTILIELEL